MRIAITVDPEIPVPPTLYGGIERIVNLLINEYVAQGHDVTLFANPDSQASCRLIPFPALQSSGIIATLRNTLHISYHILKGEFDIIHSFSRLAYLTPLLITKIPKVMSYQREPTISQIKKAIGLARKNSLYFTGCSNYITKQIKPFATANTIYNGVDLNTYTLKKEVPDDAPLVFLGRIEPIKGTHIAIEIAQRTGKKLIIAGNIPLDYKAYFENEIQPNLNNQIQYIGPVNDSQKNELLGKALAFLMPILWDEPFGIVMIEALACGTPVLGFSRGAVPEIIQNGINGFFCSTLDEMISCVMDIPLINREAVRQTVHEKFSAEKIAANYLNLYSSLIDIRLNNN